MSECVWVTHQPWSVEEFAAKVADGLGIATAEEDGPVNILLCVHLESPQDFWRWVEVCCTSNRPPDPPQSYPANIVWFTDANRGCPYNTMHYMYVMPDGQITEAED